MSSLLAPDQDRLRRDWEALATFTEPDQPYTRRSFSPLFVQARAWLRSRMEEAGLAVRLDEAGNLTGRLEGARSDLPPLVLGSHTDTVPGGGRFDGIAGVLGGLEVARRLQEEGIRLEHPLEVIDFLAEEATDYQGVSTVGSRGMVGALTPAMLSARNPAGESLADAISRVGGNPSALTAPLRRPGDLCGYLELHIEQGSLLEAMRRPVGIVQGIVGIRRFQITVEGRPDHAGGTGMAVRRDALTGAAELALGLEAIAHAEPDAVGTMGRLDLFPNAPNIVPGLARAIAEVRSERSEALERMTAALTGLARAVAERRGLRIDLTPVAATAPVLAPERFLQAQQAALATLGLESAELISRAGHDANQLAAIAPVGMFFIPSREGRSHCPEEWTDLADWAAGVQALALTVVRLDRPGIA